MRLLKLTLVVVLMTTGLAVEHWYTMPLLTGYRGWVETRWGKTVAFRQLDGGFVVAW